MVQDLTMGMTDFSVKPIFCSAFVWKSELKTRLVWLRTSESLVNFVLSNLKHHSLSLKVPKADGHPPV